MQGLSRTDLLKRAAPLLWLAIMALAAWVLTDRLRAIEFGDIVRQLRSVPIPAVVGGVACACVVYGLVGLYEGIAVRIAAGRTMYRQAFRTALIANPIGRAIGLAMVSAGALRYRMYAAAGLSALQVGAIVVLVAMPFLFAVGWLIDLSLLFHADQASAALRLPVGVVIALSIAGLAKDVAWLVFISLRTRPIVLRGLAIQPPNLRQGLVQIAVGLAQISAMSGILYLFMPPELAMGWPAFVAIYCIGFVAGQISNVPAGIGVLEAALLLMLPHVPPAKLLGAVLAYRAVYELLPLLVALVLLAIFELTHPSGVVRKVTADK